MSRAAWCGSCSPPTCGAAAAAICSESLANELLTYEALGLTAEGTAEKFIRDGDNTYGGRVVTLYSNDKNAWSQVQVVSRIKKPRYEARLSALHVFSVDHFKGLVHHDSKHPGGILTLASFVHWQI